jgi:hypothetical protein
MVGLTDCGVAHSRKLRERETMMSWPSSRIARSSSWIDVVVADSGLIQQSMTL